MCAEFHGLTGTSVMASVMLMSGGLLSKVVGGAITAWYVMFVLWCLRTCKCVIIESRTISGSDDGRLRQLFIVVFVCVVHTPI